MADHRKPLLQLRVLIEFDPRYSIYVGYCLETGSVISADDVETAEDMMKELLADEIAFALENNNLRNLLSSPAPLEIWRKWQEAYEKSPSEPEELIVNVRPEPAKPEAELSFATA